VWRVSNYKLSGRCSYSGVENECKDTMQYFHVRLWSISIVVQFSLLKSAYNFGMCRGVCINCYLILKWSTLYWLFPHYAWDLIFIILCTESYMFGISIQKPLNGIILVAPFITVMRDKHWH
jgi:hypothetical protein